MLEHTIMRNIMRIASNARRKSQESTRGDCRKSHGFGHILDLLSEYDGMSQQQIAEELGIRPQSASEAIAGMETHGLIRRETNELDRRSSLVFITAKGVERRSELRNERIRNAMRIMEPLTEEEKNMLLQLLMKVTAALQEHKEGL